jgi:hypothetical protein
MEHLSRATLQSAAHLHHLSSYVNAGRKTLFPQPVAQRLLAHVQAIGPREVLCDLIASPRVQE